MRIPRILAIAILLAASVARAGVDVVVVGAFVGGSPAGGDPAPDDDGVFFGAGVPAVNAVGVVTFSASFTTGSGGTGIVRGSTTPGSVRLVVRQGDPAPDGNGNFGNFDPTLTTPALDDAGQVIFVTQFTGTFGPDDTTGIVRGDVAPDHLTLVARAGESVDGMPLPGLLAAIPALNGSGDVAFAAPGTAAIFLRSGATTSVVAKNGQAAPDASGTLALVALQPPAINDFGQVAFVPVVNAPGKTIVEFLRADGPTISQVVGDGDPAPDQNGTFDLFTTFGLVHPLALNAGGEIGFLAALTVPSGPGTRGIFRAADPAHVVQIVRRGQQTPDANGSFLDFDFSGTDTVALNDAGQVAFLATLTGTANGTADNLGIFRGDGGPLVRVARKGGTAPGGGAFSNLDNPAIDANGDVAFRAAVAGTASTQGIFRYDDVHGLIAVVRQGDPLLGSTVAGMRFAPDTSLGRKHVGINVNGQVAFQFDLADGREGIAVWTFGSTTTTTTTTTSSTTHTTTTLRGTSTTIAGTSTTATTIGATSSTTSTTSITSTTSSTTPTTAPIPPSTTTTLPPCTTVRCILDASRTGPSCAADTVPPAITKKLDLAIARMELAPTQTPKKAKRLYKSSKHLLAKAMKLVTKAAGGRHPTLSSACAADLLQALRAASAVAGSLI